MQRLQSLLIVAALLVVPTSGFADNFRGNQWPDWRGNPRGPDRYDLSRLPRNDWNRPDVHRPGFSHRGRNPGWARGFGDEFRYGVTSGRLSRAEIRELKDKQNDLSRLRREYWRNDGYLDSRERDRLRERYADYQRDLQHELRDGEREPSVRWR